MRQYNFYFAEKSGKLDKLKAKVIDERIRRKYSISNEFAILRQRDTKPEEFAEYNAFVEQVKAEVNKEAAEQIERYSKSLGNTEGE